MGRRKRSKNLLLKLILKMSHNKLKDKLILDSVRNGIRLSYNRLIELNRSNAKSYFTMVMLFSPNKILLASPRRLILKYRMLKTTSMKKVLSCSNNLFMMMTLIRRSQIRPKSRKTRRRSSISINLSSMALWARSKALIIKSQKQ